ncbi:oxidoreductase family protein [Aaosphaeria arxii CBS 175.79]|uniref:Oxidoreductase family protein n=1 Tax=Aaosphaeria arxii CBS 175.79 TaxID=1450172 RepID=A0A6A5XT16_9PLEO|nr:oxidoreductase family protein [Aaosphaeria arxii CBS 175.79]KAF2015830.1 oxidoreductase family protein [Aaosphaeria arxii CBS 175.79]
MSTSQNTNTTTDNKTKIRVALIGLSASAKVTWAADAHLPYLLHPQGQTHYTLTALLNSSVAAAEKAKQHFNLAASVEAYGDPEALAADPDIDLVVCNTRVDVHFPVIEPSLRAGKAVFVEWPLVESVARAIELTGDKPIRNSIVGLQGRVSPIVLRVKEVLASGAIGKVLNTEIKSYGNLLERDRVPESLTYFAERKVGGHPVNIHFGHLIDWVHDTLGEFEEFQARGQVQRPELKVVGADGEEKGTVKSDVWDWFAVHGTLAQGERTAEIVEGASLVATFRLGPAFKGKPGFEWSINGTKGELLVTAPGPYLMADSFTGPITIELHDHATDEVKDLGWDWKEWQKDERLVTRGRSTAELYERFAEWVESGMPEQDEKGREFPRIHDAVVRLREFDELYRQFDAHK